jgi:hypothetical protein
MYGLCQHAPNHFANDGANADEWHHLWCHPDGNLSHADFRSHTANTDASTTSATSAPEANPFPNTIPDANPDPCPNPEYRRLV